MNVDIPHPREVFTHEGGEAVERAFLEALERGRLHHAWLLVGPEGIGKATFAYRVARRLFGAAADPALGLLGSQPDDPVCRQIMARAHPDLLILQRDAEDGKVRKGIPVDDARTLPEFFAKTPAAAPYRVAIVDTADDLNANAANAVLKSLEEPPERGVVLLISHAPGTLLPTLRSRCRRLRFFPPPEDEAAAWVADKAEVGEDEARRLLAMAGGAPGRAWRLAVAGALDLDRTARELLEALPKSDEVAMVALAEGFRGAAGAARFELLMDQLARRVHGMASAGALAGEGASLESWAEAWEMLISLPRAAEAVNLDRGDAFFSALSRLRAIA
ncbi:MAG: DNA polymerase III subunit delta' [Pseudomonadota bacterium]|nr:DNA polymerase III subunit delta' [Pseudomonadota bacterium]